MGPLQKLNEKYRTGSYEIKIKAPIFFFALISLISLVFILTVRIVIFGLSSTAELATPVIGVFLVLPLVLLMSGRYTASVNLTVGTLLTTLSAAFIFQGYLREHIFDINALYLITILLLGGLFLTSRRGIIIISAGALLAFYASVFAVAVGNRIPAGDKGLLKQMILPNVLMIMAAAINLFQRQVFTKVSEDIKKQLEASRDKALKIEKIVLASSDALEKGKDLVRHTGETLQASISIESNASSIRDQVAALTDRLDQTIKNLNEIQSNMNNIEEQIQHQSASITESSAAIQQMVASINSVNETLVRKRESVDSMIETSRKGLENAVMTKETFSVLTDNITKIHSITGVINKISGQTNLLSMNAAIEAAHSGEYGRGFSVVADEIRKLAESSGRNAKEISEIVKELMAAISNAGTNVDITKGTIELLNQETRGVADAMREISESTVELVTGSREILTSVAQLQDSTVMVTDNSREAMNNQRAIFQEIQNTLGAFTSMSREIGTIAASIGEIRQSVDGIRGITDELISKSDAVNIGIREIGD
jgi:methyl-accepting chemotaxis protein